MFLPHVIPEISLSIRDKLTKVAGILEVREWSIFSVKLLDWLKSWFHFCFWHHLFGRSLLDVEHISHRIGLDASTQPHIELRLSLCCDWCRFYHFVPHLGLLGVQTVDLQLCGSFHEVLDDLLLDLHLPDVEELQNGLQHLQVHAHHVDQGIGVVLHLRHDVLEEAGATCQDHFVHFQTGAVLCHQSDIRELATVQQSLEPFCHFSLELIPG